MTSHPVRRLVAAVAALSLGLTGPLPAYAMRASEVSENGGLEELQRTLGGSPAVAMPRSTAVAQPAAGMEEGREDWMPYVNRIAGLHDAGLVNEARRALQNPAAVAYLSDHPAGGMTRVEAVAGIIKDYDQGRLILDEAVARRHAVVLRELLLDAWYATHPARRVAPPRPPSAAGMEEVVDPAVKTLVADFFSEDDALQRLMLLQTRLPDPTAAQQRQFLIGLSWAAEHPKVVGLMEEIVFPAPGQTDASVHPLFALFLQIIADDSSARTLMAMRRFFAAQSPKRMAQSLGVVEKMFHASSSSRGAHVAFSYRQGLTDAIIRQQERVSILGGGLSAAPYRTMGDAYARRARLFQRVFEVFHNPQANMQSELDDFLAALAYSRAGEASRRLTTRTGHAPLDPAMEAADDRARASALQTIPAQYALIHGVLERSVARQPEASDRLDVLQEWAQLERAYADYLAFIQNDEALAYHGLAARVERQRDILVAEVRRAYGLPAAAGMEEGDLAARVEAWLRKAEIERVAAIERIQRRLAQGPLEHGIVVSARLLEARDDMKRYVDLLQQVPALQGFVVVLPWDVGSLEGDGNPFLKSLTQILEQRMPVVLYASTQDADAQALQQWFHNYRSPTDCDFVGDEVLVSKTDQLLRALLVTLGSYASGLEELVQDIHTAVDLGQLA